MMVDANQKWGVNQAIERTLQLAELKPWWMEEPTSPGRHSRSRPHSPRGRSHSYRDRANTATTQSCSSNSCRPRPLMSAKSIVAGLPALTRISPSCCSLQSSAFRFVLTQAASVFASMFSTCRFSITSASPVALEDRIIEYVDHLHEHFRDPVTIRGGHYMLPLAPGYSAEIMPESLRLFSFPDGEMWREHA